MKAIPSSMPDDFTHFPRFDAVIAWDVGRHATRSPPASAGGFLCESHAWSKKPRVETRGHRVAVETGMPAGQAWWASQRSASRADMQPVPAAEIACR